MWINARRIEPHEGEYLILLAIEDVSEKKRQTEALRRLSTYSMRVQDDERRRIARDLHDITGQKLALQSMNLAQMLRKLQNEPSLLPDRPRVPVAYRPDFQRNQDAFLPVAPAVA